MTRAQALLAVARLASLEADAIAYEWPLPGLDALAESDRLRDVAAAANADADQCGATPDDWAWTLAWIAGEGFEAGHE